MTVREFLATFKSNKTQVTIIDNDVEIITFEASGYACLEDTIESRQIKEWYINNPTQIKIKLLPETTN